MKQLTKNQKNKIVIFLFIIFVVGNHIFAATDPTLVNKLGTVFKRILSYLKTLATPAAGVAIASGIMFRKFSFGDEEKMIKGKKIIINAIICYAMILSIDLITKFIEAVVK
ncbi:MAG: hypothetical protein PHP54_00450 [Clostridia bacterium]|nr:hypothetical protein [Clostridia bacterium]